MSRVRTPRVTLLSVLVCALVLLSWSPAVADRIIPSDRVSNFVNVRQGPSTDTPEVGRLRPGESAELLANVPRWYQVRLANGVQGFVSKSWTEVVPGGAPPSFTLHAVDVGTGLAVYVQGEDFNLVYDAGSNDDLARGAGNRFVSYLKAVVPSFSKIDHVILSHPHRDHVELLPDVLDDYEVLNVWDSGRFYDNCGYRTFLRVVGNDPGIVYHTALADFGTHSASFPQKECYGTPHPVETFQIPTGSRIDDQSIPLGRGASMTFLFADGAQHPSPNENSLVVRLDLGTTEVLFMGDAEAGGRAAPSTAPDQHSIEGILLACCVADLAADVLIVGHHGSKTSSRTAFLDAVGAETFIVSSGPMRYGSGARAVVLPDQEVIDVLAARGTVFRTDLDDAACRQNPAKIGPDADNRAGGCDNVRVSIDGSAGVTADYWRGSD